MRPFILNGEPLGWKQPVQVKSSHSLQQQAAGTNNNALIILTFRKYKNVRFDKGDIRSDSVILDLIIPFTKTSNSRYYDNAEI